MSTADFVNCTENPSPLERVPEIQCPAVDRPLFQFGMRQMMLFFAAASAFLAAVASSDGATALVLMVMTSIVVAHVSATAIGTRLRSRANAAHRFEVAEHLPIATIAPTSVRHAHVSAVHARPRSPWHARGGTALPWLRPVVLAAVCVGGLLGALALAMTIGYRTSPVGVLVGGISFAVLGGWFAFLTASFYGVFRHGFRDATAPVPPINANE